MKNKRKKKHLPIKLAVIILAGAFICFSVYQFCNQRTILASQEQKMEEQRQQQQALQEELESINKLKEYVKSPEYAEQYLREKLGMVKEGEIIFNTKK